MPGVKDAEGLKDAEGGRLDEEADESDGPEAN